MPRGRVPPTPPSSPRQGHRLPDTHASQSVVKNVQRAGSIMQLAAQAAKLAIRGYNAYSSSKSTKKNKSQSKVVAKANQSGVYKGKVKLGKKRKETFLQNVAKYGINYHYENGANISSNDSFLFTRTSTPMGILLANICRALVKKLLNEAGYQLSSFNDSVIQTLGSQNCRINFSYSDPGTSTLVNYTGSTNTSGTTISAVASTFLNDLRAAFAVGLDKMQIMEIWLDADYTGVPNWEAKARFRINDLIMNLSTRSVLKMQNVTQPDDAAAGEDDDIDNTKTNPLLCHVYSFPKRWSTGLLQNRRIHSAGANQIILETDQDTGVLFNDCALLGNNEFKQAPPAYYFDYTKRDRFVLNPGEIKYISLSFKNKINIGYLFSSVLYQELASTGNQISNYGFTQTIHCEHMLNNRTAEPAASLDYEHELFQSITISKIHTKTTTLIETN